MTDSIDLLDLLKLDHQLVSCLLEDIENSIESKSAIRTELFKELALQVRKHSLGEETVLYPKLVQMNESKDLAEDAQEEHQAIAQLVDELESIEISNPQWNSTFKALKLNIEHHVNEEESELFKIVRDLFSEDDLIKLGQEFEEVKAKPEDERSKVA